MRRCFDGLYFSYKKPAAHKETGIDFENQPTSDLAIWQLLENFKKLKCMLLLKTTFEVLVLLICN